MTATANPTLRDNDETIKQADDFLKVVGIDIKTVFVETKDGRIVNVNESSASMQMCLAVKLMQMADPKNHK
ncbi:MAG: hypothetical protein J5826_01380 [Bacteroidales bacterium]|nr:hypothetical protein [Bacteroidales bacterium]